jgi:pyruvate dehydrogenase E1 component alpha subunit
MPLKTIFRGQTQRLEILSPEGCVDSSIPVDISSELLLKIYRLMVEIRFFDERAIKLQRQGRLGTYPQILGQEASQLVPPLCLEEKDWLIPTYRGQGCYYARGMQLRYSLLYWAGDDRGVHFGHPTDMIFSIPVGTHLTQAAGIAWAAKLKKDSAVVMAYLGDGTSSKGDFHEALTFAGQFKLPVVYVIENNHWAISVPRKKQSASETLAQKAAGYGAYGLQADGNDVFAVYKAAKDAVERARSGLGPTVLELETYRLGHHTTADDATRYRSSEDTELWKAKDPLARLKRYLESRGLWDREKEKTLLGETEALIESEIKAYESFPPPNPLDMFANNYALAPWPLIEQRAELEKLLSTKTTTEELAPLPPAQGRFP